MPDAANELSIAYHHRGPQNVTKAFQGATSVHAKAVFLFHGRFLNGHFFLISIVETFLASLQQRRYWPNCCKDAMAAATTMLGKDPRQNVTPSGSQDVINCRGTWTYLSGSLEFPEGRGTTRSLPNTSSNMFELQHAASRDLRINWR